MWGTWIGSKEVGQSVWVRGMGNFVSVFVYANDEVYIFLWRLFSKVIKPTF